MADLELAPEVMDSRLSISGFPGLSVNAIDGNGDKCSGNELGVLQSTLAIANGLRHLGKRQEARTSMTSDNRRDCRA
jgi:hypothetical protein